jgi:hypothetical protein
VAGFEREASRKKSRDSPRGTRRMTAKIQFNDIQALARVLPGLLIDDARTIQRQRDVRAVIRPQQHALHMWCGDSGAARKGETPRRNLTFVN